MYLILYCIITIPFALASTKFSDDIDVLKRLLPENLEQENVCINCAWQAGFCRNVSGRLWYR